MTTDVTLEDDAVRVTATQLTVGRDDEANSSVAVNLSNESGFWHLSGPRSYETGSPFSIFWNNLSKWVGPFLSIRTDGQVKVGGGLVVKPDGRVGVGTDDPRTSLHVHGQEVHSTGGVAGFSFSDRQLKEQGAAEKKGQRWVWYADHGVARLWSDSDRVTVDTNGWLKVGDVSIGNGTIRLPKLAQAATPTAEPAPAGRTQDAAQPTSAVGGALLKERVASVTQTAAATADHIDLSVFDGLIDTDLVSVVVSLTTRITKLESELAALQASA